MAEAIRWPAGYAPDECPVHVVNRIETDTAPAVVWSRLIAATRWHEIYANASHVRIDGDADTLSANAHFTWKTFGVALDTRVVEFEPERRIAWLAVAPGIRAYHAWLITPDANGGCSLLTEETQHGLLARAGKLLFPTRMQRWHQRWIEALAA
jgi:hypothetical protein